MFNLAESAERFACFEPLNLHPRRVEMLGITEFSLADTHTIPSRREEAIFNKHFLSHIPVTPLSFYFFPYLRSFLSLPSIPRLNWTTRPTFLPSADDSRPEAPKKMDDSIPGYESLKQNR